MTPEEQAQARADVVTLQRLLDNRQAKLTNLQEDVDELEDEIMQAVGKLYPEAKSIAVEYYWDCKDSPTGSCFYDQREDPCHDECLVCGEPEERK